MAYGRQAVVVKNSAEFIEQLKPVRDGLGPRSLQKRKVRHIAQAQRHHAQNDTRQGAAQYLGFGEARTSVEVFLVVQADANAIGHTATSTRPLIGRRLADGLDQELLHLASEAVALDPGHPRVNHIANARHGERGFGHIGGQHDAGCATGFEHTFLLGLRESSKERQHLHMAGVGVVRQVAAQVFGGISNFTLTWQKHQDVAARRTCPQFVHRVRDGVAQVVFAAFFPGAVAHFHRKSATRHHQHRRWTMAAGEMLGKAISINRGRGDDDFQVGATRQYLLQIAQQKVNVQASLVRLVNDDGVVGLQERVGLRLGQQDAIGHQLDRCISGQFVLKPHLETHHLAQGRLHFLGNPLGHRGGGDAARLGVANDLAALAMGVFGVRARILLRKIGI